MAFEEDIREIRDKLDKMFERGVTNAANQTIIVEKIKDIEKVLEQKLHAPASCALNEKLQEDEKDLALLKDRVENSPRARSRRKEVGLMGGGGVIGGAIYAMVELIRWLVKP